MIEIRACTPDDAAAVGTLLSELGYTVPIRQATENIQELSKTGVDPIIVAVAEETTRPDLPVWREKLYAFMTRNAVSASDYFQIPPKRVIELGTQVEL